MPVSRIITIEFFTITDHQKSLARPQNIIFFEFNNLISLATKKISFRSDHSDLINAVTHLMRSLLLHGFQHGAPSNLLGRDLNRMIHIIIVIILCNELLLFLVIQILWLSADNVRSPRRYILEENSHAGLKFRRRKMYVYLVYYWRSDLLLGGRELGGTV